MGLHSSTAPAESVTALKAMTRRLSTSRDPALRSLASLEDSELTLHHRVHEVGLDSLSQGKGLQEALWVGWRYVVTKPPGGPVAIEVALNPKTQRHQFSSHSRGPHVGETLARFEQAQRDPTVSAGTYELRLLRIPALSIVALWLDDASEKEDLFIPLAPTHPVLVAGQVYTAQALEALLRQPAMDALKFDVRPQSR